MRVICLVPICWQLIISVIDVQHLQKAPHAGINSHPEEENAFELSLEDLKLLMTRYQASSFPELFMISPTKL